MVKLPEATRIALLNAIAAKEGTASQISQWYGVSVPNLKAFVKANREELERTRDILEAAEKEQHENSNIVSVNELDALWISKKVDRLQRYQNVADMLYKELGKDPTDSTALREFRSYLVAAANELGQLLHRGAGESGTDALNVDIQGVDMDKLR